MSPDKKEIVNGKKVEEYYWGGKYVVYIDNRLFKGTYKEAITQIKRDEK